MDQLLKNLVNYLSEVTGLAVAVTPMPVNNLPYFLTRQYALYHLSIGGTTFTAAFLQEEEADFKPAQFIKHMRQVPLVEVDEGPGSGVKILNNPIPPAFRESVRYAEQNLYSRSSQLLADRDPRAHEFTIQLRAFDASKKRAKLGIPALIEICSGMLKKPIRGGLILVGEINLGGSIEPVLNAVNVIELAVEKGDKPFYYQ